MRVRKLQLIDFKRFSDLTIDLSGDQKKVIALVGPNGSGKSSVFDAFDELSANYKGKGDRPAAYYKKSIYSGSSDGVRYNPSNHIILESDQSTYDRASFYIRSAYRFTAKLNVTSVQSLPPAEQDEKRPQTLVQLDSRLQDNYARMLGQFYEEVYDKDLTGREWANDNINSLNAILESVLDIRISYLGNPVKREGSLFFKKGASERFPYENLSSGEKEVIDIILDIFVKKHIYKNSVICIDEPELHLNTAIQRKLLLEIEKLIPDSSQLWVATHSIGFLRALQETLPQKAAVVDFSGCDFDKQVTLTPIRGVRADWLRIFETALEDLTGLVAPKRIIYCEGRPDPTATGVEQGLDADVYNQIFSVSHSDTLFVSSGGNDVKRNAGIALKVLKKALSQVEFNILKDRDELSTAEREDFLAKDSAHRMTCRREIENYLFDKSILQSYCAALGKDFDEAKYDILVTDVIGQDLKVVQSNIKGLCGHRGALEDFKRDLAKCVTDVTAIYSELEAVIFSS